MFYVRFESRINIFSEKGSCPYHFFGGVFQNFPGTLRIVPDIETYLVAICFELLSVPIEQIGRVNLRINVLFA
jgi:hypothetical protein